MPSPYLKKMRHHQHDLGVTFWAEDVLFDLDCDSRRLFSPASTTNAPVIPTSSASYTTKNSRVKWTPGHRNWGTPFISFYIETGVPRGETKQQAYNSLGIFSE